MVKASFNRLTLTATAASIIALLTACGGGGGGSDAQAPAAPAAPSTTAPAPAPATAPPTIASAQGLYEGTIGDRAAGTVVLPSGRYYVLYSEQNNAQLIAGVVVGDLSIGAGGNTFTSSNMRDYNLETMRRYYGNLSGTFTSKAVMAGTATSGTTSVSFAGNYNAVYEKPAILAALDGNYAGQVGTQFGVETMALTIAHGGLSGKSQSGCNVVGDIRPADGATAIYALSVTMSTGCKLQGTTYSGHAVLTEGKLLRAVSTFPDLSDVVLFVGNKR